MLAGEMNRFRPGVSRANSWNSLRPKRVLAAVSLGSTGAPSLPAPAFPPAGGADLRAALHASLSGRRVRYEARPSPARASCRRLRRDVFPILFISILPQPIDSPTPTGPLHAMRMG